MWFNWMQRQEPYQGLTWSESWRNSALLRDSITGGAWLSSARVVRCWVKSRKSATPVPCCQRVMSGTHGRLPVTNRRKVGMTSSHHAPYLGLHTCYIGRYKGLQNREVERIPKAGPGSDWRLQLASMKAELLVIADQQRRGEYVPGPCTPPVTPRKSATPEAGGLTLWRQPSKVGSMIGVKS